MSRENAQYVSNMVNLGPFSKFIFDSRGAAEIKKDAVKAITDIITTLQ